MDNQKFAIPTVDKKLCAHFGHCENFAIITVENQNIVSEDYVQPPAHEPGSYPRFLAEMGVNTIIAGGMGEKAQNLFVQNSIEVFIGVNAEEPQKLVANYLVNQLTTGENLCDH